MNRPRAAAFALLLAASQIPAVEAATYVANVQAATLYGGNVEFYVAYLVTTVSNADVERLPDELRNLCTEFPRLDRYHLAVITDPTLAESKEFRGFVLSRVTATDAEKSRYGHRYLAEWAGGSLTVCPADPARTRVLPMKSGWCNDGH